MTGLIEVRDGTMMVTSKKIADDFGKVHRQVMRDIRGLSAKLGELGGHNFVLSSYTSEQNKILPCYNITRDGFSLLVMGFTGDEALAWKVKYLQAFNKMEAMLIGGHGTSVMQSLNEAMRLMEEDKSVASTCGRGLQLWKEKRQEHMARVDKLQADVQLLLNFKELE